MPSSGGSVSDAPVNKVVEAPANKVLNNQSHYLAYITPDEGSMLKQAGGSGELTPEGIPSYQPPGGGDRGMTSGGPGPGGQGARGQATQNPGTTGTTGTTGKGTDETITQRAKIESVIGAPLGKSKVTTAQRDWLAGIKTGDASTMEDVHGTGKPRSISPEEEEKGHDIYGNKIEYYGDIPVARDDAFNLGLISKDPLTGKIGQGRNTINPDTGEIESNPDLSWAQHFANRPGLLKYSPLGGVIYATGANFGEWADKQGWSGGTMGSSGEGGAGSGEGGRSTSGFSPVSNAQSNFITLGQTQPTNSVAANWYQNLGSSSVSGTAGGFNLATEYAAAKAKVSQRLGTSSAVGQLAVSNSPFYNWLQTNSLNKGIL